MSRYPEQGYAANKDIFNFHISMSSNNVSYPPSPGHPSRHDDDLHHEIPGSRSAQSEKHEININPFAGVPKALQPNSVTNLKNDFSGESDATPRRSSVGCSRNQLAVAINSSPTAQRRVSLANIPTPEKLYPGGLKKNYKANKGHLAIIQVDPKIKKWFRTVDTDDSGQITAQELQKALINGNYTNFSEDACRMMIDIYDQNSSGSIDINEFQHLFDSINEWKNIFQGYDKDQSRTIEHSELCDAFQQMGYGLSSKFVQDLLVKYSPRTKKLTLDNFIVMCVQLKRVSDGFRSRDRSSHGNATLKYEDFVGLAMGLHH